MWGDSEWRQSRERAGKEYACTIFGEPPRAPRPMGTLTRLFDLPADTLYSEPTCQDGSGNITVFVLARDRAAFQTASRVGASLVLRGRLVAQTSIQVSQVHYMFVREQ